MNNIVRISLVNRYILTALEQKTDQLSWADCPNKKLNSQLTIRFIPPATFAKTCNTLNENKIENVREKINILWQNLR